MRGMILAAGRGQRMGSLTADAPKPLLKVNGYYLIEYAIQALVKAGITEIVINICYRGEQIKAALGDGSHYGATFFYSEEKVILGTGGGIVEVLPILGDKPFIVISSDIITDYPIQNLVLPPFSLAHLVLVANPSFHPEGDFCLAQKKVYRSEPNLFTFANIGIYHPDLFASRKPGYLALGNLLIEATKKSQITGEVYQGVWNNVGTPEDIKLIKTDLFTPSPS